MRDTQEAIKLAQRRAESLLQKYACGLRVRPEDYALASEYLALAGQVDVLTKALEWYAEDGNYEKDLHPRNERVVTSPVEMDYGKRAQAALAAVKENANAETK